MPVFFLLVNSLVYLVRSEVKCQSPLIDFNFAFVILSVVWVLLSICTKMNKWSKFHRTLDNCNTNNWNHYYWYEFIDLNKIITNNNKYFPKKHEKIAFQICFWRRDVHLNWVIRQYCDNDGQYLTWLRLWLS